MAVVAVVDTNVWVSALINPHGAPAQIRSAFANGDFQVAISVPLLDEIAEVLSRPRIREKYGITEAEISEFVRLLALRGVPVTPSGTLRVCRDPDDDVVLETALLAKAQCMVSRDDDIKRDRGLLDHMRSRGIRVLSVQQFLDYLSKGDTEA